MYDPLLFDAITLGIEDIKKGRMIVLCDDESRENEGDLVVAAQYATPQVINFMITYGRGLVCMPMAAKQIRRLKLKPMCPQNQSTHGTNFLVSIGAKEGITTGISADDRSYTVRVACSPQAKASDIVSPGHVFPLGGHPEGLAKRQGHTEAAIKLVELATNGTCAVICEILNTQGRAASHLELKHFCRQHGLRLCSIRQLIDYAQ